MKRRIFRRAAAFFVFLMIFTVAASAQAQMIYRVADREDGVSLLMANDAHYSGFTQNDLDYRMQKKGATLEEWLEFAPQQVLAFTAEEEKTLERAMSQIEAVLDENGYTLPALEEIVFVKTTMREEGECGAYTAKNQIFLGEALLALMGSGLDWMESSARSTLCHEIFHCLTRNDPQFRRDMYGIIGFTVGEEEFELSDELREVFISNPDVEHHNAYAAFTINGEKKDCFVAAITTQPFEEPGDSFFTCIAAALVPVDDPGVFYMAEDASDFWEVFGRNTGYVIDPEECLADNFGYALTYGSTNSRGEPYATPEIIEAMIEYLKK